MTFYIAGPMTGLPEFNYPAFEAVTTVLRSSGAKVVSPHELHDGDTSGEWADYMRVGLRALLDCSDLVLLPGWGESKGARLEREVALGLGMKVYEWPG